MTNADGRCPVGRAGAAALLVAVAALSTLVLATLLPGCGARAYPNCCGPDGESANGPAASPPDGSGGPAGPGDSVGGASGGPASMPDEQPPVELEPPESADLEPPPPATVAEQCRDSGIALASLVVRSRAELEALSNCEVLEGDLTLEGFQTPDLAPLGKLQTVSGTLTIGVGDSLRGLEQLRQVGRLTIEGSPAPTLEPLRSLTTIGASNRDSRIGIVANPRLTSLAGFAPQTFRELLVADNPLLESLGGMPLPARLDVLHLRGNPSLRDVDLVPGSGSVDDRLELEATSLTALSGLSAITNAARLVLSGNPLLDDLTGLAGLASVGLLHFSRMPQTNLDALSGLRSLERLILEDNAALAQIDVLAGATGVEDLQALDNPALDHLPAFNGLTGQLRVVVERNATLRNGPRFPRATGARRIEMHQNPALAEIDGFGALEISRAVDITQNGSLASLLFPSLRAANSLRVSCNPLLPAAALTGLEAVVTSAIDLSGNLGSEQPCLLLP